MGPIVGTIIVFLAILGLGVLLFSRGRGLTPVALPHMALDSLKWPVAIGGLVLSILLLWILLPPGGLIFWGLVIVVGGYLMFAHLPSNWGGWRKLPILLGLTLVAFGIYQSGLGKWTAREWENKVEKCLGASECPAPEAPRATVAQGPVMIIAGNSGQVIAPVQKWSDWIKAPESADRCFDWTTDQPREDDVETRFMDWEENIWSDSTGKYIMARSWKSKKTRPVRIYYERNERPPEGCRDF